MKPIAQNYFNTLFNRYPDLNGCRSEIEKTYFNIVDAYRAGGKILVCGNGGSAADAEHIVGELMKGFCEKRPISPEDAARIRSIEPGTADYIISSLQQGLPAISLISHTSLMTAFANDVHAELIFAQQVWSYGTARDLFLGISTSGNSTNVWYGAVAARAKGMITIGLTGKSGGKLLQVCDVTIRVPSDITWQIQEYHLPVYHTLCLMVEQEFFGKS